MSEAADVYTELEGTLSIPSACDSAVLSEHRRNKAQHTWREQEKSSLLIMASVYRNDSDP